MIPSLDLVVVRDSHYDKHAGEALADPNLFGALRAAGQNPAEVLDRASEDAAVAALAEETERAMALGVFGSPSFVIDGEVFWGDDRLDDAISWA